MKELRQWLRTSEGQTVIDDAVLGCLMQADVDEVCAMFSVSAIGVWEAIGAAISDGF